MSDVVAAGATGGSGAPLVSVPIPGPLQEARFLERPNRFLVLARLERTGEVVAAHMADPGRLKELLLPGVRMWLKPEGGRGDAGMRGRGVPGLAAIPDDLAGAGGAGDDSDARVAQRAEDAQAARRRVATSPRRLVRATAWTALLVEASAADGGTGLVSLHTTLPNRLAREALLAGALAELGDWTLERAEVPLGRSRIDFLLARGDERLALEVKSVSLVQDAVALFPDAVTERGARHLRELAEIAARPGWAAAVLFVVQRPDAREVRAAAEIDPVFAAALAHARAAGVRALARRCHVSLDALALGDALPVS